MKGNKERTRTKRRRRGGRNGKKKIKKTILPDLHLNHSHSCHGDVDSSSPRCLTFRWLLPSNRRDDRVGFKWRGGRT